MSPIPGHVPDRKLDTDLFELIGQLRRNADTSSRFGQADDLERIADELLRWSARLRKALLEALEPSLDPDVSWVPLIAAAQALRKTHESMLILGSATAQELIRMEQQSGEARQELDRMRKEKRNA